MQCDVIPETCDFQGEIPFGHNWRLNVGFLFLCYPLNSVSMYGAYKRKGLCLRTGLVFLPLSSPPQDLQSKSLVHKMLKLKHFIHVTTLSWS